MSIPTVAEVRNRLLHFGVNEFDESFVYFLIEKTAERIKVATNLSEVPENLHNEFIDEVAGSYLTAQMATGSLDIEKAVKSISEGDTSVSFSETTQPATILKAYFAGMLIPESTFARYRVMTW